MSAPAANARSEPGDDDRPDALVGVEGGCRGDDVVHHLRVQRVERLGTVQGDPADATAGLDQDRLVRSSSMLASVLRRLGALGADRVDDPREILPGAGAVRELPVDLARQAAHPGVDAGQVDRLLGEPEVLRHERAGEAGLVVAVRRARGHRPGNRAVGRQRPALPRRVGCDVEQRLVAQARAAHRARTPRRRRSARSARIMLLQTFAAWPRPGAAAVHDPAPHRLEQRPSRLEVLVGAAHHEGERGVLGADDAARDRRVDAAVTGGLGERVRLARLVDRDRRGVDEERSGCRDGEQSVRVRRDPRYASITCAAAREHRDDDLGGCRGILPRVRHRDAGRTRGVDRRRGPRRSRRPRARPSTRFCAIGRPMCPSPRNATLIGLPRAARGR